MLFQKYMETKTCWVLTLGIPGMDNQSLGVAEALGMKVVKKFIQPRAPWKHLPAQLWPAPLRLLGAQSDPLHPPWPDVVIGTGRLTTAVAAAIRKASGGKTFTVKIQDPKMAHDAFDLIVTPRHDRCVGANVLHTHGGLHAITQQRLADAKQKFAPLLAHLPRPLVAVMMGGTNKCYNVDAAVAHALADKFITLSKNYGAGIVVTPSRRTGAEVETVMRQRLAEIPSLVWDGAGDNPYLGFLALADYIVVTADSVNMVSEACFTGNPVYVAELAGGSAKFRRFHKTMNEAGMTRPFTGELQQWTYPPLNETEMVAAEIKRRMALTHKSFVAP